MKANTMELTDEGMCTARVTLKFNARETNLRAVQATTFRMAAELVEAMDRDIELANYKGAIYVDHAVVLQGDWLRTFIIMEACDDADLERARAVADVVHDMTELLRS